MKTVIIIPARFQSSRFQGKPLAKILGKEMILRVLEICEQVLDKKYIFVATDSSKISNFVRYHGYNSLITSKKCLTGSDRVAEASRYIQSDIYINVQGDEPLIKKEDIKKIITYKKKFKKHVICGFAFLNKKENPNNRSIPKVVLNNKQELVYISRLPIPGSKNYNQKKINFLKQVCVYAFTKKQLFLFSKPKKKTEYENIEDIEILRFFDLDTKIKMVRLSQETAAVDYKSDIKKVELLLKKTKSK